MPARVTAIVTYSCLAYIDYCYFINLLSLTQAPLSTVCLLLTECV